MEALLVEVGRFVGSMLDQLIPGLLRWTPLAAWIVFWLFGVNWVKLRKVMLSGGLIGVVLIGLVIILVWGSIAPPADGAHHILGLTLENLFVVKAVYVSSLICIMFLCGAAQLAGCCAGCCQFEEDQEPSQSQPHTH